MKPPKNKSIAQMGPIECKGTIPFLDPEDGVIEHIFHGGQGDEAIVTVELRTVIPGITHVIKTTEGIVTAVRREKYPRSGLGHTMFLINMLIKKLDDFFTRTGVYTYSHIPRAFGSISIGGENPCESCLYEWFPGEEGFPWKIKGNDEKMQRIMLTDWDNFVKIFGKAGINIGEDCYNPRNKTYSKNIIHQFPYYDHETFKMNVIWKRIDYGFQSIRIDYDRCTDYLKKNRHQLKEQLRPERFDMMELTVLYLSNKERLSEYDLRLLMNYIQDYRLKSVDHYISHGTRLGGRLLYLDESTSRTQALKLIP